MRLACRLAALAVMVLVLAVWFFGGLNLGWTKTTVPVTQVDPVTELEYVTWERRYLPGVDFLLKGAAGAGVLFGGSYFFRKK